MISSSSLIRVARTQSCESGHQDLSLPRRPLLTGAPRKTECSKMEDSPALMRHFYAYVGLLS